MMWRLYQLWSSAKLLITINYIQATSSQELQDKALDILERKAGNQFAGRWKVKGWDYTLIHIGTELSGFEGEFYSCSGKYDAILAECSEPSFPSPLSLKLNFQQVVLI